MIPDAIEHELLLSDSFYGRGLENHWKFEALDMRHCGVESLGVHFDSASNESNFI